MEQPLKLADAVRITGLSRKTLLRRIRSGALVAARSGTGDTSHYLVTTQALADAGLLDPQRVAS